MSDRVICEDCCYWDQRDRSFSANHIIGECTKDADNNYTNLGMRHSLIGYKFTSRTYSCKDHTERRHIPVSGGTKLAELEKRLSSAESLIAGNRLAYDQHLRKHKNIVGATANLSKWD